MWIHVIIYIRIIFFGYNVQIKNYYIYNMYKYT